LQADISIHQKNPLTIRIFLMLQGALNYETSPRHFEWNGVRPAEPGQDPPEGITMVAVSTGSPAEPDQAPHGLQKNKLGRDGKDPFRDLKQGED
jgi:hypothetical protein